jgi:hypothetical protein
MTLRRSIVNAGGGMVLEVCTEILYRYPQMPLARR